MIRIWPEYLVLVIVLLIFRMTSTAQQPLTLSMVHETLTRTRFGGRGHTLQKIVHSPLENEIRCPCNEPEKGKTISLEEVQVYLKA